MSDAITAAMGEARSAALRRLHPALAFLGGLIGLGYLYVGRIAYAMAFVVASYLSMFAAAWMRVLVDPVGWYAFLSGMTLLWLVQLVHPSVLAWSRPFAPAKPYNRWWGYIGWIASTTAISFILVPTRRRRWGMGIIRFRRPACTPRCRRATGSSSIRGVTATLRRR